MSDSGWPRRRAGPGRPAAPARGKAFLVAVVAMFGVFAGVARAQPSPLLADLPAALQEKVAKSVDASLQSRSVAPDRSANDLGWDCLAATELGAAGDARAEARLRLIVAELQRDLLASTQGKPMGWKASVTDAKRCPAGGYDAFGDGSCNPPDTAYAFQTGLGIACLARAAGPLRDPRLLTSARQVLSSWEALAMPKAPCRDCLYFPTSSHANDAGRYVRNMNVFMAFGAASLGAAGDASAQRVAQRALASELVEQGRGNKGYLGVLDPQWIKSRTEADRIENHAASIAVLARQTAALTGDAEIRRHALAVWQDWAFCSNDRCRSATCSYWAADPARCQATQTAAHCAFRQDDARARELCLQFLGRVEGVGSFGIWAVGVGAARR